MEPILESLAIPRLRAKNFPVLTEPEGGDEDMFYGGPVPKKLTPKLLRHFQLPSKSCDFDFYFEEGQMEQILESFELSLVQVNFYHYFSVSEIKTTLEE